MRNFVSELFDARHDFRHFECGEPSLDDWLKNHASRARQQGTASTHVWVDPGGTQVRAYYSIAPTQVVREAVSSAAAGGNSVIPGYLIGRLALDQSIRGQGLGVQLLLDALEIVVSSSRSTGGRLIVVDALDDAARDFYVRRGFTPTKTAERLVMKISTAATLFG